MSRPAPALLSLMALFLLLRAAAMGQAYDPQTGEPPPGSHSLFTSNDWALVLSPEGQGIDGKCVLDCYTDEQDVLYLRIKKGLKPKGQYSVWLVRQEGDAQERAGVGQAWDGAKKKKYFFVAYDNGSGFFRGCLPICPLGKWRTMELRYHPDGYVKDLQGSVLVAHARMRGR